MSAEEEQEEEGSVHNHLLRLVVRSEDEAYALLAQANRGHVSAWSEIKFDGWPKLEIHLSGEKFHSSLTPPLMKGLLEFQKGIYQSFAAAKYNNPTKRLSEDERKALEIIVRVVDGTSDVSVPFDQMAIEFVKAIAGKMDSTHVLIVALSFLVLYFGHSAFRTFLEHRKEVRLGEVSDATQRKMLETLEFQSKQETERTRILTEAIGTRPQLQNIAAIAHDAQTELVRGVSEADEAKISGVSLSGKAAMMLELIPVDRLQPHSRK